MLSINGEYINPQKTPTCYFSCDTLFRLDRHEKSCTDVTKIKYSERIYGENADTRQELIDLGVIEKDFKRSVVAYDIESISIPQNVQLSSMVYNHATQSPLSIALAGEGFTDFFVRTNMTEEAVGLMVRKFLIRLECLGNRYYNSLPEGLKEYYNDIKNELKSNPSVQRKSQLINQLRYIRGLFRLTVIGFNSQGRVINMRHYIIYLIYSILFNNHYRL